MFSFLCINLFLIIDTKCEMCYLFTLYYTHGIVYYTILNLNALSLPPLDPTQMILHINCYYS